MTMGVLRRYQTRNTGTLYLSRLCIVLGLWKVSLQRHVLGLRIVLSSKNVTRHNWSQVALGPHGLLGLDLSHQFRATLPSTPLTPEFFRGSREQICSVFCFFIFFSEILSKPASFCL